MSTVCKNSPFKIHISSMDGARENFHPRQDFPLIEFASVPFDLRRVKLALFDSTYRSPITLLFPREHADEELASDIAMIVELAHALYELDETDTPPAECYDTPYWYLRGMAHFTGPTGESETAPMHAFLTIKDGNEIGVVVTQIVTDQSRLTASTAEA